MYTYSAQHDRTRAVPAQLGFSGEPTKGKIALRPTRMGIVGKVKRLDASPFDSVSPSRAVPSRVGVANDRDRGDQKR